MLKMEQMTGRSNVPVFMLKVGMVYVDFTLHE